MNKWNRTDEAVRRDKIYRQCKILRDARFKFHLREIKPDIHIRFCSGKQGREIWGC